jgi:serine/threonine-protein kinase
LFAAALSVAVVAAAWTLLGKPPTVATLVVSVGLAAGAGLAAAIGAGQSGRRARARSGRL